MTVLLRLDSVMKKYQALRPLRIQALRLGAGEVISVVGLDASAAEMLIALITGATLPDEGDIYLFERPTRDVTDSDAWLAMLDGVGILTERAVFIPQFSLAQNLAMPLTLQVDPLSPELRQTVERLASEVGLLPGELDVAVAQATPELLVRARLARALALGPQLLLLEHPSAELPRQRVPTVARDIARIAAHRQVAVLTITADEAFARSVGGRVLAHDPVSGALQASSVWHRIFGRGHAAR